MNSYSHTLLFETADFLQTRSVLCEAQTERHVDLLVFTSHSNLLYCNNALIPDRKQQHQQNTLLGFRLFGF
jgi:hypothetical protein